jgi:hypothetical protein
LTTPNQQNITAINTLFHSSEYPSSVVLPLVDLSQLPPFPILSPEQNYNYLGDEKFMKEILLPFLPQMGSVNNNNNNNNNENEYKKGEW